MTKYVAKRINMLGVDMDVPIMVIREDDEFYYYIPYYLIPVSSDKWDDPASYEQRIEKEYCYDITEEEYEHFVHLCRQSD